jgi:ribonuclease HII
MNNFCNLPRHQAGKLLIKKIELIAGVDEAGRGPLAGPVVSAAVIFKPGVFIQGVNDSKQLTENEREELLPLILEKSSAYAVSVISHGTIDRINILKASLLSMSISVTRLSVKPDLVLVDGNKIPTMLDNSKLPVYAIVDGDEKFFCIASASIIAKVTRDRIMKRLSEYYPQYLWHKNKGYATQEHIDAIKCYGPTSLHRKTFLRKILPEQFEPYLEFQK